MGSSLQWAVRATRSDPGYGRSFAACGADDNPDQTMGWTFIGG
jgi:hypothetical protein